jgi:hypothetical protein
MYSPPPSGRPDPFIICTHGRNCVGALPLGLGQSTIASAVWPGANIGLFWPFRISGRRTYTRAMTANGTAVAGNIDVGVYDLAGNRLFSTGSVAQAGTSIFQRITINWTLDPGHYLLALACSSASATFIRNGPSSEQQRSVGIKQMTAAGVPLPATATFAALASSYLPTVAICEAAWI